MKTIHWVALFVVVLVVLIGVSAYFANSNSEPYFDAASPVKYFYSPQCTHCIAMKPILRELAAEGYRVAPYDVLANTGYWTQYNINGTPTWLAANGDALVGEQTKDALGAFLASHGAKLK